MTECTFAFANCFAALVNMWWTQALFVNVVCAGYMPVLHRFVAGFHRVRSAACVRGQSVWRGYAARKWTADYMASRLVAVRMLQPIVRWKLLRARLAYARRHRVSATHLQRVSVLYLLFSVSFTLKV